jgi:hypothetical protein
VGHIQPFSRELVLTEISVLVGSAIERGGLPILLRVEAGQILSKYPDSGMTAAEISEEIIALAAKRQVPVDTAA